MVYQDLRRLNCPLLGNHIGYLVHCYLQLHCKLHLLLRSLIPIYFIAIVLIIGVVNCA